MRSAKRPADSGGRDVATSSSTATTGRKPSSGDAPLRVDLERERKLGRIAGIGGLLTVVGLFALLPLQLRASPPQGTIILGGEQQARPGLVQPLREFHANQGLQFQALAVKVLVFLAVLAFGLFLYDAIRRRDHTLPTSLAWLTLAAPLIVVGSSVIGFLAYAALADQFVGSGLQTEARASDLKTDSVALRFTVGLEFLARVVFGGWLAWIAHRATQVGLTTRFLGVLALGAGAAGAVGLISAWLALFAGWLGSVAILALGYWPGGRPPAWETGKAESPDPPVRDGRERQR